MAFETHMKELRELTQKLEQGNLPLEEGAAVSQGHGTGGILSGRIADSKAANFQTDGAGTGTGGS